MILFKVYFQQKITIITAPSTTTKIVKTFELKKNCRTDYFDLSQTTNIHTELCDLKREGFTHGFI